MIISFFISLIFPSVTKAQDSNDNNFYDNFSIQVDTDSCPEELIVKVGNDNLFCVQDTELELPEENDTKYEEEEKKTLKLEANNFTRNINKFANTKKDKEELIFDPPSCENLQNCLIKSPDKNYYYFRIVVSDNRYEYFIEKYDTEIIKIGLNLDFDVKEKWQEIQPLLENKRKEVLENIKIAIEDYRTNSELIRSQDSSKQKKVVEQEEEEVVVVEEQEELNLSKQAVRIQTITGAKAIFYIRTWNNGISPSERAQRVSKKIEKIVKGEIDIQGLGIFEQSTKNEGSTNKKPKIIKIISDSKLLSESEKNIMEVTYQDALFEGKNNAADLAKQYLLQINKHVDEYKSNIGNVEERGYPVVFLGKPLFFINSGLGNSKSEFSLYDASHRASVISDRIEEFAQKNWFLTPNTLVAAYSVNKGLCILSESLKAEDYKKFKANSNLDEKNETNCKVEDLVKRDNLSIIYSDEITEKINRGDWKLTDTTLKNSASLKRAGLPETIIFMELNEDNYEHLMNIQVTELDHILHQEYAETKQDLAIYFRNQIEDNVIAYTSKKRIWLIICIVLLVIILQLFFGIYSTIKQAFSFAKSILFKDISVVFQTSQSYLFKKIAKITDFLHPNNNTYVSNISKLFLLAIVIIFALYNVPKINFIMLDLKGFTSRFLENQKNIILSYIFTEVPRILFILFFVFIFYKISTLFASIIENKVEKNVKSQVKPALFLVRILLIIFSIILIAPHLPAAGTIYFKGISAFAVLAFTWSASSVISDFVSGIILIFLTSLNKEDWVKVGDTIGKIEEQNLFFHKIITSKNCIKTIPNSFILNNCTTNLTTSCKKESKLILPVPVGLGYDVPRELVEITLIVAALKTEGVVKDISNHTPFVLITNLGDFAVSYELNVYTDNPELITTIYSDLQKNIQDECDSRGIEILSPNYSTLRFDTEGTATT